MPGNRGNRGNRGGNRGGRGRGAPTRGGATRGVSSQQAPPPLPRENVKPVMLNEINFELLSPEDLRSLKVTLLNTVSSSLIKEPRFTDAGSVTNMIKLYVGRIAYYDPEFVRTTS
jgi:hypothetical protein